MKVFEIQRSCLSEIDFFKRQKLPTMVGFRDPDEKQTSDSRKIKKEQFSSQTDYYKIFNQIRNFDFLTTVLAIFGLVLAVIDYECQIQNHLTNIDMKVHPDVSKHPRVSNSLTQLVRLTITFTTIGALGCLIMRHYHKQKWITKYFLETSEDPTQIEFMHYENDKHFLANKEDFGHRAPLLTRELLFELFLLALQPLPLYDSYITFQCKKITVVYLLSEVLLVLMSVRIYFLIRCVLNYCEFMDAFSKKICRGYGFETGVKFTIKSMLIVNPESTVMYIFFATVFIFAYLIRIFEMPYFRASSPGDPVFDNFFNAIWFTVITLTTIGYGDISPGTQPGMLLTILLAFWGSILLSLLVVTVSSIFTLDQEQ